MDALRHDNCPHQRIGPQNRQLSAAFQGGPPALVKGIEQNEDSGVRGLRPHPHLFGCVALDHSRAAERGARHGDVRRFDHVHGPVQEIGSRKQGYWIDR